ncbi:alpha-L-fucosidase [Sphingobacterium hungaricum]|uniref:alpha-L-fucosidase n=1 Tax=Sphingobacterium hungaricum TaxID=2082723 RepID=A0A928UUG6_9SPHI|nr:alpha-L-fucosidase [Sphingobacterium hungaricum]MBE8713440.1 alpha-L-fucosidase [Sphingobacterium hungaricum]
MKNLIILALCIISIQVSAQTPSKSKWFEDARYGMFIHWGLYSGAEGLWKGENLRYENNYAEWIRYRNRISKEEYGELAQRFVWDKIDPEQWVLLAKEAGMKYIIMTSKHHDGVAIWDTKIGDYSLSKLSGTNRDVIKELADACRKHGMKLGFYYSHWLDWSEPYAWDHNQEVTGRVTDAQYNQYWQEKVIPQLTELLTNYGDIALMWFDMWIPYQESIIKKEQLEQVVQLIRKLQPNCLINSRLGLPTDQENVDFETLGDNTFSSNYIEHPWETPGTIAHSWGYNGQEKEWKSTGQLFESLLSNVSLNGGFTLNIGPRADGSVPYESITRLHDVGNWLKKYGEAVYGNTGLGLRTKQHDWGTLTTKTENGKQVVYAEVFNWPLDSVLRISGITSKPSRISVLNASGNIPVKFEQFGPLMHIKIPSDQPDPYVSVVKMEFEKPVEINKEIVGESTFGGFSANALNVLDSDFKFEKYNGLKPNHLIINSDKSISWKIFIAEKGTYKIDLSTHNPNTVAVPVNITVNKKTLKGSILPDGKITVEPNMNYYTDEFVDHRIGEITVDQIGEYIVTFKIDGSNPLLFNRIWIAK